MDSQRPPDESTQVCPHCGGRHPAGFSHCPQTGKPIGSGRALVGRVFAERYKILDILGEGGMGTVYLAEHDLIGRKVAIKRLHPKYATDPGLVARFQREARAAARTGHENIVEILDMGTADDPFIVMEYLEGQTLAALIRKVGPLPSKRAAMIVGQVLAALDAVHRHAIVHRDLKPENIFLTRRSGRADYVKVLDFGVSKMQRDDREPLSLTRTGVLVGTPYYLSPEQARGSKKADHRVDIYAVGAILYESLTGRVPFEAANYHALLQAIVGADLVRVRDLAPTVPVELEAVVHRAMSRTPEERFPTAHDMWFALVPFGAEPPDEDMTMPTRDAPYVDEVTTGATPRASTIPGGIIPANAAVAPGGDKRRPPIPAVASTNPPTITRPSGSAWATPPVPAPSTPSPPTRPSGPTGARVTPAPASKMRPPQDETPTGMGTGRSSQGAQTMRSSSPSLHSETMIKGALLLAALNYATNTFGRKIADGAIASCPPTTRARLASMILPVAWLPITDYQALLAALEEAQGSGNGMVAFGIGEATAERELKSTHKAFMHSATPGNVVERLPQLFRAYHDSAELVVAATQAGAWRVELKDLVPDRYLHSMSIAGFLKKLLELAGAEDVRVQVVSSRERGDTKTILTARGR